MPTETRARLERLEADLDLLFRTAAVVEFGQRISEASYQDRDSAIEARDTSSSCWTPSQAISIAIPLRRCAHFALMSQRTLAVWPASSRRS